MSVGRRGRVFAVLAAGVFFLMAAPIFAQEEPADLDKIPAAVMNTLHLKFPQAKIVKWTKETEDSKVIYDLEFTVTGRKSEADFTEDGLIQNFEMEFPAKYLPKPVTEALQGKYPQSKIKSVMSVTEVKNKKDFHRGYEITFETADNKETEVMIAPDGKIFEDSGAGKKEESK